MTPPLELTRAQILAHRRRVSALDERFPFTAESLRVAAWAGLQDSMPRAALLSIHARVSGANSTAWEHPSLVQVWGPRYAAYVLSAPDLPSFSLGRLPDGGAGRRRAEDLAARLRTFLDGRTMRYDDAGRGVGVHGNMLRYAAQTGTVLIRWEGARLPTVWTVPPPEISPFEARLELARRYLHVFGPTTAVAFKRWAGIGSSEARAAFDGLVGETLPVRTPVGASSILAADESTFRAPPGATAPARLLPSGDTFFLMWGIDRELLVPDAKQRADLWTSRVWPGALLVNGEVAGTWRRAGAEVGIQACRQLSSAERATVEAEVAGLPLPEVHGTPFARWDDARSDILVR